MNESPISVLLVDDDASYVDVVRHHLNSFQARKFTVRWVNSGDLALATLRSTPDIDLVIMDYFLPSGNGIDIAKNITAAGISLPMILLTSNKDLRIAIEAMKYGVDEYLVKDDRVELILPRTIVNVVNRFKLNKQVEESAKAERMAKEKTEAIAELVVTMCHEFNNPLAAIKISTDILLRQKISDDDRRVLTHLNRNILLLEQQIVKLRDLNIDSLPSATA